MNLTERVFVNARYTRSTNLERDRGSTSIVESYLPTTRAIDLLEQVLEAIGPDHRPRAWSVVGPYGSGKSTFALYLHELLGSREHAKLTALNSLRHIDAPLARAFAEQPPWCRVVLTGSEEPLTVRLLRALDEAATAHWSRRPGRNPAVVRDIRAACQRGVRNATRVLRLVDDLHAAVQNAGDGGLLIIIDEMGRFLEYDALHAGGSLIVLQELAERAFQGSNANLLLCVLLHQGFDLYARGLGEKVANDWAKVQGRFETISFVEAPEQILRIVSAAFSNNLTDAQRRSIRSRAKRIVRTLVAAKALPAAFDSDEAASVFATCYPIHPVSLLVLPLLCQRFAQNERTLFSYLGSREPSGLWESISSIQKVGDWIHPSAVYDYFIQNQPALLTDPLAHRRWVEVVASVERAENADAKDLETAQRTSNLAKTIGLLNLVSTGGGLKASPRVLRTLFPARAVFDETINHLLEASVVQFRRFSGEYRVWQGTDFDLDERTRLEVDKLGRFDLAPVLREHADIPPVVARRHSARTGTLRYFEVDFADHQSTDRVQEHPVTPRIVFFIAERREDELAFDRARAAASETEIWALYRDGRSIRAAVTHTAALSAVQRTAQELATDAVAAREIRERLLTATTAERDLLDSLLTQPATSDWYWSGRRMDVTDRRTLQRTLSRVMDRLFISTPIVRNELINRNRPSSQAAAARNKLFQRMLANADQPRLGIEKYPPELAIYRSILEAAQLHAEIDGTWRFVEPEQSDTLNLRPTWQRIDTLLAESETTAISLQSLMDDLAQPPFGIRHGVSPILFLHYYLLRRYEIAVYEEGTYSPVLDYEHVERMVRRPDLFSFQRFRIDGVRAALFDEYSNALFGEVRQSLNVLSLAAPLTTFVHRLDSYSQRTLRLTPDALRVRQAVFLSKSPEKLLFSELPRACGFEDGDDLTGFAHALLSVLRELKEAHASLLDYMRRAFCNSFTLPPDTPLVELRELLRSRCHGLDRYTVDVEGLRSFIRRAAERDSNDEMWFSTILLFLGRKPTAKWSDQDRDAAEYRLAEFSARLVDLERLRVHFDSVSRKDRIHDVILVKTITEARGEIDEIVAINAPIESAIMEVIERLEHALLAVQDDQLKLAAVARFANNFLHSHRKAQLSEHWSESDHRKIR